MHLVRVRVRARVRVRVRVRVEVHRVLGYLPLGSCLCLEGDHTEQPP